MIHQYTIKLADLGCSHQQGSNKELSNPRGIMPYIDPKILNNDKGYELTKKSDIYSLGVIF